jgi:GNAT superfamily N-acetyltransferase
MAIVIRDAGPGDVGTLLRLVRELAAFEERPDAVRASEADLIRDGFGAERRFEACLAEIDGRVAGFALFFPNYSTWEGRPGLFLEDIFVSAWARRHGVGRALLRHLAAIAIARGWARLDLNVLTWNPARGFYEALGIGELEGWVPYRIDGAALKRLARG